MMRIYIFSLMCFMIFIANLWLISLPVQLPLFFTSYLNDFLCLPVVLGICHFVIRTFGKVKHLRISLFSAFSLAFLYSYYFEFYLPEVTERYTADIMDILLYFTGALAFYLLQPRTKENAMDHKK